MNAGAADLAWLPGDADEQLALGLRIVSNSYKNRVQTADTEIRQLKAQLAERGEQVSSLQKKCSALEVQLIEQTQRGNQLVEENKQLIATTRKLQKDIQRLENLKKAVLTSIQEDRPEADDSSPFGSAEAAFPATARRTVAEISSMEDAALKGVRLDFRRAGTAHGTVLTTHEDPSANADGRAFFRAARSRLSFETFNAFLANIKRLNNQQQDREETLRTAERLFGEANADLFEDFKTLLTRHA
ncbi:hypothetical protein, conserved [Eimeria tenella]|uniref:At4g15545-like C-terminal domain-containing protein n=1 Tax=Eimeria tenella TaxID=5802 RepID=U6KS44_EIMTE|nr:hypothetical protein, conserved [Eimeria tenella]CDJ39189.1 hypothetical protein, conserved [Eimeria tenella]|eukprot:XP_013229944.1 hypothetical protein, conserved [Eimeria tenella]